MKNMVTKLLLIAIVGSLSAQPLKLDMQVFADRRAEFMAKMDSDGIAFFPSKPEYSRNLDVKYDYRQESNFYYLSGFEEPESLLMLNPSAPKYKFVLFIAKPNPRRATYEGAGAGIEDAMTVFQADTAIYKDNLLRSLYMFGQHDRPLYYTFGINPDFDDFFAKNVVRRRSGGNWPIIDPEPLVAEMRLIKNDGDWQMGLQKAIDISAQAHIEAMKSIEPGMYEYEIQAVFEYVFRKNGSQRNGYPCIVGTGPNSTILHYSKNIRQMQDGEVILMDCAAEYGYYSADITRTVPVNGKFTQEQKNIYKIVLDAQKAAIAMVKPGIKKSDLNDKIDDILGAGLVDLGFIKDKKDYRIFTLHGYSHWIGLEVHDVGAYTQNGESVLLAPGMVFTIEPGIYVRPTVFESMKQKGYSDSDIEKIRPVVGKYMNIGVRIEDDIAVTETGYENLSQSVPREIKEIEKLMGEKGIGNAPLTNGSGN